MKDKSLAPPAPAAPDVPVFWFAGGRNLPGSWAPVLDGALGRVKALGGRVVVGCAFGLDYLAARRCWALNIPVEVWSAWPRASARPWVEKAAAAGIPVRFLDGFGRWAPAARTRALCASLPAGSWLVAFPGGKGTELSLRLARKKGLKVWEVGKPAAQVLPGLSAGEIRRRETSPAPVARPKGISLEVALAELKRELLGVAYSPALPKKETPVTPPLSPQLPDTSFTCACGWTVAVVSLGPSSCWMCQEYFNPLSQYDRDRFFLKSFGEHPEEDRELDPQALGWPEEAGLGQLRQELLPGFGSDKGLSPFNPYADDNLACTGEEDLTYAEAM